MVPLSYRWALVYARIHMGTENDAGIIMGHPVLRMHHSGGRRLHLSGDRNNGAPAMPESSTYGPKQKQKENPHPT